MSTSQVDGKGCGKGHRRGRMQVLGEFRLQLCADTALTMPGHMYPCFCAPLVPVFLSVIQVPVQTLLVFSVYLSGSSAVLQWGKPIFPVFFRGMFSFAVWWSVWLRWSKELLSALSLTSLEKSRTTELSKPLGEKIPLPFSCQKWPISQIPSQLSKSYISAAELVADYFSGISQSVNRSLCDFSRGRWKSWIGS